MNFLTTVERAARWCTESVVVVVVTHGIIANLTRDFAPYGLVVEIRQDCSIFSKTVLRK